MCILYIYVYFYVYTYLHIYIYILIHIYKYIVTYIMYSLGIVSIVLDIRLQCFLSATKLKLCTWATEAMHMGNGSPVNSMNQARQSAKHPCSESGAWRRR